jgi:hypothetical protein
MEGVLDASKQQTPVPSFILHAMHLLCGAGFSAIITSVTFSTVANLMHRWIIHDIHNILLTQKFASTKYLGNFKFSECSFLYSV